MQNTDCEHCCPDGTCAILGEECDDCTLDDLAVDACAECEGYGCGGCGMFCHCEEVRE